MAIKVVLADDEPIILKGLRKLIPWNQYGMEIVGQAFDGRQLLEVIEHLKPDIVISDISMPHLSGIEMIKEVHRKAITVKIIFISAYQEFSYAKDALAYGAVEYLVKPLEKQEMEQALQKAVELIRREGELEESHSKLIQLERKSKESEIREWLLQLTDGTLPKGTEAYHTISKQFEGPCYTLVIVEVEWSTSGKWHEHEKKLVEFAIENILTELIQSYGKGYVLMKHAMHVCIINHEKMRNTLHIAKEIQSSIAKYLKLQVSIGLSQAFDHLESLSVAYEQATDALQNTFFMDEDRMALFTENKMTKPAQNEDELNALRMKVIDALLAQTLNDAKSSMKTLMEHIGHATKGSRSLAISTCFTSMYAIIQDIRNIGVQLSGESFELDKLQGNLEQYRSFSDLTTGVIRLIEELYHQINKQSGNKEKLLISRVKNYIDENFAKEITLETASAIAYMNPYYFSSFFKKHTGQNFKQYVTEIRVRHALHLLATTDLMIYEIAERCGYNNARHFSDMFKKKIGMLPQEYRQSLTKE